MGLWGLRSATVCRKTGIIVPVPTQRSEIQESQCVSPSLRAGDQGSSLSVQTDSKFTWGEGGNNLLHSVYNSNAHLFQNHPHRHTQK